MWVGSLKGVPKQVVDVFKDHNITGNELLALGASTGRLKSLGVMGAGTVFLLLGKIKKLIVLGKSSTTFGRSTSRL